MKAALLVVALITGAFGQISAVNFATSDSNGNGVLTWPLQWGQSCTEFGVCTPGTPVSTTAGHGLVCSASVENGSDSITTITDSAGQATGAGGWLRVKSISGGSGRYSTSWYIHSSASLTTVTIGNGSTPTPIIGVCEEFNATITLDKTAATDNSFTSGACTGCSWTTGTTAATSTANELLWAACAMTTADFVTYTTPAGWSVGQLSPNDSNTGDFYKLVSSTGTQTASGTYTTSPNGGEQGSEVVCVIGTFTYVASGGASSVPVVRGGSLRTGGKVTLP